MKANKLLLIDGNSLCYRAHYAIKNLTNSKGQPTNAIYGFITMLNKLIESKKPDYIAVAFDLKGPTFRHEKFKEYKANRKPMPDDLVTQMPIIKEVLRAYNISIFEKKGFEADDVLATIARICADKGLEVYIVTSDKDILQLVTDNIRIYNPYKEDVVIDKDAVRKQFDLEPGKLVDVMSLSGDAIDNIPGVNGIGEKTAINLIKEFGSLEKVLLDKNKIRNNAVRKAIEQHEKEALMSKELATINNDVPIDVDVGLLKVTKPKEKELFELFKELEFRALLKGLDISDKGTHKVKTSLLDNKKDIEDIVLQMKKASKFGLYCVLQNNDEPISSKITAVSVALNTDDSFLIPLNESEKSYLDILKPVLEDSSISKVVHNGKAAIIALHGYDIKLRNISFDTILASYLLNSSRSDHGLEILALENLGIKLNLAASNDQLITQDETVLENISKTAGLILKIMDLQKKDLEENNLTDLFKNIELPLVYVLADMEITGVTIDERLLNELSVEFTKLLNGLIKDIYDVAGCQFNINSPKQLALVLFEKLKLPIQKRTKTGISTDVEVLEKLSAYHALPSSILKYRELSKLKSTYVDALPKLVNKKTGKIHTSFNQTVTQTGRLSSSNPNLQNIPIRTEIGRQIRKCFIPQDKDNLLISSDYSQIELRVLAHISADPNLINAFNNDLDIHRFTASLIFNVKEDAVTDSMRSAAKTVNFGIIYGMSAYGLSKELNISADEAKDFIDAYFKRYPKVNEYIQHQIEFATKNGYVRTLFNRKRFTPELKSADMNIRQFAQRVAINMPIQGTASDIIKLAMIEINNILAQNNFKAKMILQVHDELVFDSPKKESDKICEIIKNKMEGVVKLKVPIKVDIKKGKNWLIMQ